MVEPRLREEAMRWIADDIDPDDRGELQRLLVAAMTRDEAAAGELAARMAGPLRFGTAGLRGPLRAGPNGMNRAVVIRATAGLADWLRGHGRVGTVVVGRDARHGSERFAADAAGVLAAAGFDPVLFTEPVPTPIVAFAVRRLGAAAGVAVTASHNPATDNGYKVYLDDGAQIAPPTDRAIERAIEAAPAAVTVPVAPGWRAAPDDLVPAYLRRTSALARGGDGAPRPLRVAATPLHGVGGPVLADALRLAGFDDLHLVAGQADPDPDFPTVAFPNPEEPGATDALLELADAVGADLAIALDPDGDRCALGCPDRSGRWRMLRGDETGALLGQHLLTGLDRAAHPDPLVATSIVSSSMLASIAAAHRVRYDETLTGFKWLVRSGDGAGTGLVYAYEEALGLCVDPDAVRDKDGISAAVVACDLAAGARADGRGIDDLLDELAAAHGVHLTDQLSVRLTDHPAVAAAMAALRARLPTELAGVPVRAEDLRQARRRPDDTVALRGDGLRVMVRPSGTEPKLKAYLQVVEPVGEPGVTHARTAARRRLDALREALRTVLPEPMP